MPAADTDLVVLESLDFDAPCEVGRTVVLDDPPCPNEATWSYTCPGCRKTVIFCADHRASADDDIDRMFNSRQSRRYRRMHPGETGLWCDHCSTMTPYPITWLPIK
jgi:hypothetical protein